MKKQIPFLLWILFGVYPAMSQVITFDGEGFEDNQEIGNPYSISNNGETFRFTIAGGAPTSHRYRTVDTWGCGYTDFGDLTAGTNSATTWIIETVSGSEIDLGTIKFNNLFGCYNYTYALSIEGFKNNVSTGSQNFTVAGMNSVFTSNTNFNDVDKIVITGADLANLGMDDLNWSAKAPPSTTPTVITSYPIAIASTAATLNGNVTVDGGASVTERGFVYGTAPNPTTENNKVQDGSGTGIFTEEITGLSSKITYYVRAYAINSSGTSYGDQVSFLTPEVTYDFETGVSGFGSKSVVDDETEAELLITSQTYSLLNSINTAGFAIRGSISVSTDFGTGLDEALLTFSLPGNSFDLMSVQLFNANEATTFTITPYVGTIAGSAFEAAINAGETLWLDIAGSAEGNAFQAISSFTLTASGGMAFVLDDISVSTIQSILSPPSITTEAASEITFTTATLGGDVTEDGGAAVTDRGIVFSSSDNTPTLDEGSVTKIASGSGTGEFFESVTGLTASTTYYFRAYATNSAGTSYGEVESFSVLSDDVDPQMTLPTDLSKSTDLDACYYTVIGTELDPLTATDNSGSIASLTYSLKKLLPSPSLISEDFNSGSWNSSNFEIGSTSGSVVNKAYRSANGDNRGTLRTVSDFRPTVENPVYVSATLRFSGTALAFIGTRATGLKNPSASNEPLNALYFRIHNFNNGQTNLTSTSFDGRPGNSFYSNPIRVAFVDNGSNITGTFTNTVTNQVLSFNQNTSYNSGSWRVVFSGGTGVSWDDIKISFGPHEYIQEYDSGSNSLAGVELELGEITVEWTAKDNAGNSVFDSFLVTVADTQAPSLTVGESVEQQPESGTALVLTIPDAVFSDNCSEPVLTWKMSGTHSNSGSGQIGSFSFNPGSTKITYTVTDASGNTTIDSLRITNTYQYFPAGIGTESDPYQISDWEHLFNVRFFNNKYFVLINDLDNSSSGYETYASSTANAGSGWIPGGYIGGINFDGKGFSISDLNINRAGSWENGIFGYLYNSSFKNLLIKDFQIEGGGYVGSIVGYVESTLFENIQISGCSITSNYYGGLLIGGGNDLTILNSTVEGEILGNYYLGGFLGELYGGKIENSYANVSITGLQTIGGLIGYFYNYDSEISVSRSYAKGTISGQSYLGGLIGQSNRINFQDVYSQVKVTGSVNYIGGISGIGSTIQLTNAYSTDSVSGPGEFVGVILGRNSSSELTNVFWDKESTGIEESLAGGLGKTTAEMKTQSTFIDWDFENVWTINPVGYISYPYFQTISYDELEASPAVNPVPGLEFIVIPPTVTDANISISGATGIGGVFKIGDTVTVSWNNTSEGDNNTNAISSVTVDFSQFGGEASVEATNSADIWTATYTLTSGIIDDTSRNVSVTVTDVASEVTTTSDTTNPSVDIIAPVVSISNISISGATGVDGTFKIGDTITATWDNSAIGDNNSDAISGVTVNFSEFGGGTAVAATNSNSIWTATFFIASGGIDANDLNVSVAVTDNAGNTTTGNDTSNASLDNSAPTVSVFSPANNSTEVSFQPTLTLTFSEEVVLGSSGVFQLGKAGEEACTIEFFQSFDLSNPTEKSLFILSEDKLSISISLSENLPANTRVLVELPSGFVSDLVGNPILGFSAATYNWSFTTINKFEQSITFDQIEEKTYGDAVFTLGNASTDRGLTVTYTATDPTVVSISGNQATILKAGSTTITATQTGDETNFAAESVERTLTVGKKGLTITAASDSKIYDGTSLTNSGSSITAGDLVEGHTYTSTITGSQLNVGSSENVASTAMIRDASDNDVTSNYEISYTKGTLTVGKKDLTITATDKTKVYGSVNPELTFTYEGLVNGDTKVATEPSIATTATTSSNVGTYPITLEGAEDANYSITMVGGELEVTQATVTITANDKTKVYGSENPELTFTYEGLVNGDTKVATEPSIATTATTSSNVGTYPITLEGAEDANYTITMVGGELVVTQAGVTITATDKTKVYGAENPELTFTYEGLVNGDTKVATEPSISTTATLNSGVGVYPITLEGAEDANYTITMVGGELEVTQATVTITANDKTKVYGAENPELTFTYEGLVNGDTKVATEPSISTTATLNSGVGVYPITLEGAEDANYTITMVGGELEVTKAGVTITANDKTKVYGAENPELTFTYEGLVNGDTKVATEPSIATTATASSSVGTYPITLEGAEDANYTITMVGGELEVTKAGVTITATDKTKVYGAENPELTFTYEGLVNGDTKVATEPSIATTATASSSVGTYPIQLTGAEDVNYSITMVGGELEVTQATVTITANDKTKVYGSVNPELTFTYEGLVNGDTKVATEPSIATTATASSNVGTYPITLEGAEDANYTITMVGGELEVTKAGVTITANDKTKVYGSVNPELTFTYEGLVNGDTKVATEPSISTTATLNSGVGVYPITLEGAEDANYTITMVGGELEVTKAGVTITANDKTKVYGSVNPELTFTYEGLVNGDTKVATEPSISTTATLNSGVGVYPITLEGAEDANYTITMVGGELEVTQATVTITATDKTKVYGQENPELTFTYEGLVNGDTKVATEPSISTTATLNSGVGVYPITLEGAEDANYTITMVGGELEVTQATVTITANDKTKVYGQENPELTFTYEGLVNGDTKVATEPSIATTATASSNVGTYPITLEGAEDANYTITMVGGELEVTQATVTITATDKTKVYGAANPELTFTYEGLVNGDTKVATEPIIATTATASSSVGTYPITLEGAEDANYTITMVEGELEVTQAGITITATDKTKVYGQENPELTFTYEGLMNGDTKVATEPSIATTATTSSNVGTYPIQLTGAEDVNYSITMVGGELEVTQATVTVTATDKTKVYGQENPELTFTYEGLVNGDTKVATEPSIATTATASSSVGTYPIQLTGAEDVNYSITMVGGELEVTQATITITATDKTKVYGAANPELTFTYEGLVNGDTKVASEPSISTTATTSSNVGTYPIQLTGAEDVNYSITMVGGELEVTQATVTITANDKTKVYGAENPELTFTYEGLVNGDTKVATEPSISTTATLNSGVGVYPITLEGAEDANYTITMVGGELEVTQATVTITATDKTKVYGQENPELTFTYEGLVNGDTKVATEPSISTTATLNSEVGVYPITLEGAEDVNYTITMVGGELEVTQATVTITANDKTKVYGAENPELTFTYEGLVNGDTKVATEPSIATTATTGSSVGTYPITLEGAEDANYTITMDGGELEVTQATVTITANDKTKVYGQENPVLTFSYTGLVNGDTKVATEPSISTTATLNSGVGVYPITLEGAEDANYTITMVGGELEVTQATVTITANDKTKVYGSVNPELTFTYEGLVNGDTKVATEPSIATTATTSSNVGTYPITLEGAEDANYTITMVGGELEVTKAGVTITANDKTKVYGQENPELTFTYEGLVNGDTKVATEPSIATTATASSSVGTYPIQLTGAEDANYTITMVGGELEVTKAMVTGITFDDGSFVYDGTANSLTITGTLPAGTSVAYTNNSRTDVGTQEVTATIKGANFETLELKADLTITPATATGISFVDGSFVFDGTEKSLVIKGTLPEGTSVAYSNNGRIDVGTLEVTAMITGSNFTTLVLKANLTITPGTVTGITLRDGSFVFDGTEKSLAITGTLPEGTSVAYTNNGRTDVGTQEVTATISGSNYTTLALTADLTITPAAIGGVTLVDGSFVYDGTEKSLAISGTLPEGVSVTYTNNSRTDVGTQGVTATISGSNYTTLVLTADLTITPAAIGDVTLVDGSFVYDGTAKSLAITGTLPAGTSVAYTNNSRTDVGTQGVTATISGSNYTTLVLTADLTITPAAIGDVTLVDGSFVYDGTEKSLAISGTLPAGTSVSYTNNSRTLVGIQEVTATINGSNFNEVILTADLSITPATLMVTADDGQGKVFGTMDPPLTYEASGFKGMDTEAILTGSLSRESGEDIGSYEITQGSLSAGMNYTIDFTGADFVITEEPNKDSDGDGVPDEVEEEQGTDPTDPMDYQDEDGDDVPDYVEEQQGTNPQNGGDYLDSDGDDVPDYVEEQQGTDPNDGDDYQDVDGDGIPDYVNDRSISEFIIQEIEVLWGIHESDLKTPTEVVAMTAIGEFINLPVVWDLGGYNALMAGTGNYNGTVEVPDGLFNPDELTPILQITVLAKPAPTDVTLSANSFIAIPDVFFQEIGVFTVIDPTDDVHTLTLPEGVQDNDYFEVIDGILFWSSAEQAQGRTGFTILLRVEDRGGNVLEKSFQITRQRTPLDQLDVPNTFTPNGDGANDTWGVPALRYYQGVRISIMEVGGNRVFYTENPDIRWDGTFDGKDMPVGAYFWIIEVAETGEVRRGVLNLLRQ